MAFKYDISEIDRLILESMPERGGLQGTVAEAMYEAVAGGGKRVRPMLMYESYRLFAGESAEPSDIKEFMAAMEMIHTSSLIHDDLPCMDNDTLRRGRPTTWVRYGEDMATLAGDALMVEAFAVMNRAAIEACPAGNKTDAEHRAENPENPYRRMCRRVKAAEYISEKTGIRGMIGGQVLDVEKTGKSLSDAELDFIYRLKTGALLEASMLAGAVLGGADEDELEKVEKVAAAIGFAFQIKDDILDETSSEEELGKPIHSDEKNSKTTYVSIYGLRKAEEEVERLSEEAKEMLSKLGGDGKTLLEIIDWLIYRNN